jgi:hypothetical protein
MTTNLTGAQRKTIATLIERAAKTATHEIEEAFGRSVYLTIRVPSCRATLYKVGPRGGYEQVA